MALSHNHKSIIALRGGKRGFTLLELLVVIAVMVVLVGLLLPALSRAREQAKYAACLSNIHGIMVAVNTYCQNNDDHLPYTEWRPACSYMMLDFPLLMTSAGVDFRSFHCPSDKYRPGAGATFWREAFGFPIQRSNHLKLLPGMPVEVDYSYWWSSKMILDVDQTGWYYNDCLTGRLAFRAWKLSDVRHPSKLIPFYCIPCRNSDYRPFSYQMKVHGPYLPSNRKGYQAGFIDGHAEWVPLARITRSRIVYENSPAGDPTNLEQTKYGIKGIDVY